VIRGGKEIMIPAGDIVPGDVCLLGLGDKIPADLRMISVSNLATGEAALTGESVPIDKVSVDNILCCAKLCISCAPHFIISIPLPNSNTNIQFYSFFAT
jgi:magnesium-transporting ATPase (P-type)